MRGYCLLSTKKDVTYFGEGSDAYETLFKGIQYRMNTTELIQSGLLEFFSPEEAKQIIKASELPAGTVTRLDGKSIWVPISRLKYLPLFALALGAVAMTASPMGTKTVVFFGGEITAGRVVLPLIFILTDAINELFGYQITKRCIRYLSAVLVVMAAFIQLALSLDAGDTISTTLFSDATSDDIIRGFEAIYRGLPQTLLIGAGTLLIADTFNAYLFAQLKSWMQGRQLWVRSLCSNCFASMSYTLVFGIFYQLCRWELPGPGTTSLKFLLSSMVSNLLYFIAALPLLYYIRDYIYGQEVKIIASMGHADLLDDRAIRKRERKGYWG